VLVVQYAEAAVELRRTQLAAEELRRTQLALAELRRTQLAAKHSGAGTSHSREHGAWCIQSSGFVEAWDQELISSQPLAQRPLSLSPFLHAQPCPWWHPG
jgi:hypothetical protein